MKHTTEIIENLPLDEFIAKLDNPENMKYWQKSLVGDKEISGKLGTEGEKMELHYDMGRRQLVLIETIIKSNSPCEFPATYKATGLHNIQKNAFIAIDSDSTKWISESEFRFNGIMMKIMAFLVSGAFKKQSMEYLQDFKGFAEQGISVTKN